MGLHNFLTSAQDAAASSLRPETRPPHSVVRALLNSSFGTDLLGICTASSSNTTVFWPLRYDHTAKH